MCAFLPPPSELFPLKAWLFKSTYRHLFSYAQQLSMRFGQGGEAPQNHVGWQGPLEVISSCLQLTAAQVAQVLVQSSFEYLQGGGNSKRKPKYCTRKKLYLNDKKHTGYLKLDISNAN